MAQSNNATEPHGHRPHDLADELDVPLLDGSTLLAGVKPLRQPQDRRLQVVLRIAAPVALGEVFSAAQSLYGAAKGGRLTWSTFSCSAALIARCIAASASCRYDAFGDVGTIFRGLAWGTPIFFRERGAENSKRIVQGVPLERDIKNTHFTAFP